MNQIPAKAYSASRLGFKAVQNGTNFIVSAIYPGGPADLGGMMMGDEIIAVNSFMCQGELEKWLQFVDHSPKIISIIRAGKLIELTLPEVNRNFYSEYTITESKLPNNSQKSAIQAWRK
jgi:predicted metalloprotease with PDZ domain